MEFWLPADMFMKGNGNFSLSDLVERDSSARPSVHLKLHGGGRGNTLLLGNKVVLVTSLRILSNNEEIG